MNKLTTLTRYPHDCFAYNKNLIFNKGQPDKINQTYQLLVFTTLRITYKKGKTDYFLSFFLFFPYNKYNK